MRPLLLSSLIALSPIPAFAEPQCALQATLPSQRSPAISGRQDGNPSSQLLQSYAKTPTSVRQQQPHSPLLSTGSDAGQAVAHIKQAGSAVVETGPSHGFRTFIARNQGQFMMVYLTPDGSAYVNGLMSELSPGELSNIAPGQITSLAASHGLQGLFVRNGRQFQVFYVSPDGNRVVPGSLIDADGHNITKQQIASIPGAVPTVVIGDGSGQTSSSPDYLSSALKIAETTHSGVVGIPDAPNLWVFIDPLCSWSVRAIEQLRPYVADGRVRLSVVPTSVLDPEDHGQSTIAAKAMLSLPADAMVAAWRDRRLNVPTDPAAGQMLAANMAAAESIRLRGTPTFIWRKTDGTEGRADGLPKDVEGMISSVGR